VAGNRLDTSRGLVTGLAIYNLAGIEPSRQYLLLELQDDRDIPLKVDDHIVISGRERFSVGEGSIPADDNPCLRKPVNFVMNEHPISPESRPHHAKLTFEQIAAFDHEFHAGDGVFAELRDVPDAAIIAGMRVLVQDHDRFYTSPCGNVGFGARLEAELESLRGIYGAVDCLDEGTRVLVIIRRMPLAPHWNRESTDVLIQVPQAYPLAAMDMFWVTPGLRLADGRAPQSGDQLETYGGQQWQRFSWHYPQGYGWNPAVDGLLTHIRFARTRLTQAA
jgi:hypothetical protein